VRKEKVCLVSVSCVMADGETEDVGVSFGLSKNLFCKVTSKIHIQQIFW
jgi:hypothetical protein